MSATITPGFIVVSGYFAVLVIVVAWGYWRSRR